MARRFGFFPIMIAAFATTVAFTLPFQARGEVAARAQVERIAVDLSPQGAVAGTPAPITGR